MFSRTDDEGVRFHASSQLTPAHWLELQRVVQRRVLRYFRTQGLLDEADAIGMLTWRGSGGFSIDASVIEIGGKPILWHIMKLYSANDVNDFVICCGYRGYVIKEYFANYFLHMSDITLDMTTNRMEVHRQKAEPWRVTLVDTGDDTKTGGRLKRVAEHLEGHDAFCFTYGDGLSDLDIRASIDFHRNHGKLATVAAVEPPGRFGALVRSGQTVTGFTEKPRGEGGGRSRWWRGCLRSWLAAGGVWR